MREVSEMIGVRQAGGRPQVAVDNTFWVLFSSGRCCTGSISSCTR